MLALGCLVADSALYYGDTTSDGGAIYRMDPTAQRLGTAGRVRRELGDTDGERLNGGQLTVQQPRVTGYFIYSATLDLHLD